MKLTTKFKHPDMPPKLPPGTSARPMFKGGWLGTSLQRPPTANDSSSCPCNKSDSSSSKVICASCSQSWHQNCCNLKHLTPACIKKLTEWTCPKCYICPLIKSNPMDPNSEAGSLTETIKNCSTELTKSSSAIESLNPKTASLRVKVTELVNKIEFFSKAKVYNVPEYSNANHVHTKDNPAPLQPNTTSSSNPTPVPSTCLIIGDSNTKYVKP